ncbi:MAG: hypothetical protein WBO43_06285 [Gemmatimonadota bacterium]
MLARTAVLAAALLATGSSAVFAQGPGDPTTVFAEGLGIPCRIAFDSVGNLLFTDIDAGEIWSIDPAGEMTLFTNQIPDPRWVAFDAFGWLLVTSHTNAMVHRVSPQGEVTNFAPVDGGVGMVTDQDGSVWVAAVDTLWHFDAMGRQLDAIATIDTYGIAARGIYPAPTGNLYLTGSAGGLWELVDGVPEQLQGDLPLRWWGLAFDVAGNGYWAHEAYDEGDVDRLALIDLEGNWLNEAWSTQLVDPCRCAFGRDPDGTTNSDLYIGQRDGTIVKVAAGSTLAAGWPVVGIRFSTIDEAVAADELMGVPDLLPESTRVFLDVIGNNDDSYDVGDFRAYLIAAGVVN